MKLTFIISILCSFILYIGCSLPGQATDSSKGKCSELAGTTSTPPILGEIIYAGRNSSGVLFIVDNYQEQYRLFFSKNNILLGNNISAYRSVGGAFFLYADNDMEIIIKSNAIKNWDDAEAFILNGKCIECDSIFDQYDNSFPDAWAKGWNDISQFLQYERPNTDKLIIAKADEIKMYRFENFPPATHIEYLAQQQSGEYLLVTRPYYNWNGEVVLHYGLSGQMEKYPVIDLPDFAEYGSKYITFRVGSNPYKAFFGMKLKCIDTSDFETVCSYEIDRSWLQIGSDTLNLERKSGDIQILNSLGFDCAIELR